VARQWKALGQMERAGSSLSHAMRCAEQLEQQVTRDELPQIQQENAVVQLFRLYLEGAKHAVANGQQQSLANNLLAKAVHLAGHPGVTPDPAVGMRVALCELQVQLIPRQQQGLWCCLTWVAMPT
jgi:hypothetical protein